MKQNVKKLKVLDLMALIREALMQDRYRFTVHALARMAERKVTVPEVIHVLTNGRHEKRKDTYDSLHGDWNYAILGETIDGARLRIAVAIEEETQLLVITVIRLGA